MRFYKCAGVLLVACNGDAIFEPLPGPPSAFPGQMSVENVKSVVPEFGHPGTFIQRTAVDNPEIRTLLPLPDVSVTECTADPSSAGGPCSTTSTTSMPMQITSSVGAETTTSPDGVAFLPGDVTIDATGDGLVDATGMPFNQHAGSLTASTVPWLNATKNVISPQQADLFAQGVRVGYAPLTVEAKFISPNPPYPRGATQSSVIVELDPSVILVPVQAVIVQTGGALPGDPPTETNEQFSLGTIAGQLQLWDGVQHYVDVFRNTEGLANIETARTFDSWLNPHVANTSQLFNGGAFFAYLDNGATGSGFFTPDSVFRDCGVQFRLVSVKHLIIDDTQCRYPFASLNSCSSGTCQRGCSNDINHAAVSFTYGAANMCNALEASYVTTFGAPTLPTVIFTASFNFGTLGLADTIPDVMPVSCLALRNEDITTGRGLTLAHEIAHWGNNPLDCRLPPAGTDSPQTCELANEFLSFAPPTTSECGAVRSWAISHFQNWWDTCPTNPIACEIRRRFP